MIGLDTAAIIDLFRGDEKVHAIINKNAANLCAANLVYFELMIGLDVSEKRHRDEEYFYDEFFQTIDVFPLDQATCKKTSNIFNQLRKQGKEISSFDCAIAATLLTHGVHTIITRNNKHFSNIAGMTILTY